MFKKVPKLTLVFSKLDSPQAAKCTNFLKIFLNIFYRTANKISFLFKQIEDQHKVDPEKCTLQSQEHDRIHWNYIGKFLDGNVFDQGTFKATIGHHQVITGVDIGMRGLCVGDKRRMTIHPEWGYGERGVAGTIPPNSVLVFDVELTSIERPNGEKQSIEDSLENMGGVSKDNKLKVWRRLHPAF